MYNDEKLLKELLFRYPVLSSNKETIYDSYELLKKCFTNGGKLLVAGNGGSASDSEHIVGELMKGFCLPRHIHHVLSDALISIDAERGAYLAKTLQRTLPAISLTNHNSLSTAVLNDLDGKLCFAQQVLGYGKNGDVFLAISTSGNSENVILAAITAKAIGMHIVGLTGGTGGKLADIADILICVNEVETYKVQELHLPIYHCLCRMLEWYYFRCDK
jgi:D-sedoheptulose 7-phosphate isomerase